MTKEDINKIKDNKERIAARKEYRRLFDNQTIYKHSGRKFYENI